MSSKHIRFIRLNCSVVASKTEETSPVSYFCEFFVLEKKFLKKVGPKIDDDRATQSQNDFSLTLLDQ